VTGHSVDQDTLDWCSLAGAHRTTVFYMGMGELPRIIEKLRAAGASRTLPAAVIERATLPDQRVVHGTLDTIAGLARKAAISPPALLIIGEVTAVLHADELAGSEDSLVDGALA